MTDHPIIFSAAMVQALLAGRKTMTRRLAWGNARRLAWQPKDQPTAQRPSDWQRVKPGDRLWVRENLYADRMANLLTGERTTEAICAYYTADDEECLEQKGFNLSWTWKGKTLPSIHMPRIFSRLTLVVTATKIERLQEISIVDVKAEGFFRKAIDVVGIGPTYTWMLDERDDAADFDWLHAFRLLWFRLHGRESWDINPEVVALTFAVHQQNIDSMKEAA